jgi:hypothetical protein
VVTAAGETAPDHPIRLLRATSRLRLEPLTAADLAPLGMPDLHEATAGNPAS